MTTEQRECRAQAEPLHDVHGHNSSFTIDQLDYELPQALIAQAPADRRDDSRLLVVDRASGTLTDSAIRELPRLLRPGDLLVMNDTKVLPAKFTAFRRTGGRMDALFVAQEQPGEWTIMLSSRGRLRLDERLNVPARDGTVLRLTILDRSDEGLWRVGLDHGADPETTLATIGEPPLPPYIQRLTGDQRGPTDAAQYQTVYAREPGSVAAPTAGLHFTEQLLHAVRERGVETAYVTLHVGIGTFRPIRVERLHEHKMHSERFTLPQATVNAIAACRARRGRVIAVGTTTVRVLESCATTDCRAMENEIPLEATQGATDIFIYPPFRFRVVDALLTNFHLPRSTLLALVMAFGGVSAMREAYAHAIANRYRFYSYGDAMLIQ